MTRIKDEDLDPCMNAVKLLYRVTGRQGAEGRERDDYYDVLEKMTLDGKINAAAWAAAPGIPPQKPRRRIRPASAGTALGDGRKDRDGLQGVSERDQGAAVRHGPVLQRAVLHGQGPGVHRRAVPADAGRILRRGFWPSAHLYERNFHSKVPHESSSRAPSRLYRPAHQRCIRDFTKASSSFP